MDGSGRAHSLALTAKLALFGIDICYIIVKDDSSLGTGLDADTAAYAGSCTGLLGNRALVVIDAGHEDPHTARALVAELDDVLRASLGASAASRTLLFIHNRKSCFRVHSDGAELAGCHTVPAAQATVRAACISAVESRLYLAGLEAVIDVGLRAIGASAVATHHSHHRSLLLNLITEYGSNFLHNLIATHRTEVVVEVRSLHGSVGESTATRESATAAIGARHHLLHLIDARILLHLELLRDEEEDESEHQAEGRQDDNGPNDSC